MLSKFIINHHQFILQPQFRWYLLWKIFPQPPLAYLFNTYKSTTPKTKLLIVHPYPKPAPCENHPHLIAGGKAILLATQQKTLESSGLLFFSYPTSNPSEKHFGCTLKTSRI